MKSLEIRSKSKEEAINKALVELNSKLEDLEIEVLESPTKGFLGFLGAKEGLYRFTVIEKETDIAKSFVKNILKNSNIDADLSVTQEGNLIKVDIRGQEAASLIGRRGETLDSIIQLYNNNINDIEAFRKIVYKENQEIISSSYDVKAGEYILVPSDK